MLAESVDLLKELLFLKSLWIVALLMVVSVTATVVLFRLPRGVYFDTFFSITMLLVFWLFYRLALLVQPSSLQPPGPPLDADLSLIAVTLMVLILVPLLLAKTAIYREIYLSSIVHALPLAAVVMGADGKPVHYNTYYQQHFQPNAHSSPAQLHFLSQQQELELTAEALTKITGLMPLEPTDFYCLRVQPAGPGFVMVMENVTQPHRQVLELHEKTRNLEQVNQLLKASLPDTEDQAAQQERRFFLREMNHLMQHELTQLHEAVAASLCTRRTEAFFYQVRQVRLKSIHCHQLLRLYLYRSRTTTLPQRHLSALIQALCQAYRPLGLTVDLISETDIALPLQQADCLYRCVYTCLESMAANLHSSDFTGMDRSSSVTVLLRLTATHDSLTLMMMDTVIRLPSQNRGDLPLPELFWQLDGTFTHSSGSDVQRLNLSLPLKAGDHL